MPNTPPSPKRLEPQKALEEFLAKHAGKDWEELADEHDAEEDRIASDYYRAHPPKK